MQQSYCNEHILLKEKLRPYCIAVAWNEVQQSSTKMFNCMTKGACEVSKSTLVWIFIAMIISALNGIKNSVQKSFK